MPVPVIGAALSTDGLKAHRDWILEKNRDVEVQSFYAPMALDGDWSGEVAYIKTLLEGHTGRLGIHGPFIGFSLNCLDPEIQAVITRRMMQALDVCEALGATQMVVHSPFSTWDHNNMPNNEGARDWIIDAARSILGDVVTRAESQGVTLVVENIEDIDPADRLRLAHAFQSDAVRLSIDTGHAHYAHGSNGAPPVDYYVKAAGDWLHHVHLQDADGYADRHWAIGQGSIHWHAVFRAIAELDHQPRLVLELRDHNDLPGSMAYLEAQGLGQ